MDFHLVGGFLGSGKTTAIVGAARHLIAQGKNVGIVTNDQGKYLVDTAFFRAAKLPTVEVTGGCFCCNYDDLHAKLQQLRGSALPDAIFAESVGSCADIIATVVKPFLYLNHATFPLTSFTVFTDARLLRRRLRQQAMPFSDDVVYIFDKQIEEAGLLIVNKIDLLSTSETNEVKSLSQIAYSGKVIHYQNSHSQTDVASWLQTIQSDSTLVHRQASEIDYDRYAAGESELAWLDETIVIKSPTGRLQHSLQYLVAQIQRELRVSQLPLGHVKFHVKTPTVDLKLSLTPLDDGELDASIPELLGDSAELIINARVQSSSDGLRVLIQNALDVSMAATDSHYQEVSVDSVHPGYPRPTHRMA